MTVGSLFAGIGGFDLGFERAGFEIRWQVEIDPFCRAVLAKHWPAVKRYEDVRHCTTKARAELEMDSIAAGGCGDAPSCPITYHGLEPVDVVVGGFPCQDISVAGRGAGLDGARSGLWSEYARLIGELRPRYVVVENVAALLGRGLGRVLGNLAAIGYDAEWDCLRASDIGAKHERERIWIVAYPHRQRSQERLVFTGLPGEERRYGDRQNATLGAWWTVEPNVVRVVHGIPGRVDRIGALGNAVVPQMPEWIARRIQEAENRKSEA